MKKILYLHGLGSSANSMTVSILKKQLKGQFDIVSFDLYHDCDLSINLINQYLMHNNVDLIIGTSLGAFYALCIETNVPKILMNPALNPYQDLKLLVGYHEYFTKRQNEKEKSFYLSESDLEKFLNYAPIYASENDLIIISSKDEILGNTFETHLKEISYLIYEKHIKCKTTNLCGHSMSAQFVKNELIKEINEFLFK